MDSPHRQTSALLLLPGELRNRIFTLCISLKPINTPRSPNGNHNLKKRASLFGACGNLQYACRQLRRESTPLFRAKTALHVHAPSLRSFLVALYMEINDPSENIKPSFLGDGNLVVKMYYGVALDITLLIRLTIANPTPTFQVRFKEATASLRLSQDLHSLFCAISNGSLHIDLGKTVKEVWVTCSKNPRMKFVLAEGREVGEVCGESEPRKWIEDLGAPKMMGFGMCVEGRGVVRLSTPLDT